MTRSLCIALVIIYTAASAQVNMIRNGNFESAGGSISEWKTEGKDAVIEASASGGFITGKSSAYLKSPSDDPAARAGAQINQLTAAEAGKSYTLSFFARGEKAGQVLTVIYDAWRPVGAHWYRKKEFVLSQDWKKYTMEESIPAAAEWDGRKLTLRFGIGYGAVFLDDVVFVEAVKESAASTRRNILENPGFDDGVSGWFAEGWGPSWNVTKDHMQRDFTVKHSGSASLKLFPRSTSLISRRYPFKPDTAYTASFYLRADDNSGEGVNAFLITPDWKISRTDISASQLSRDWKRYTVSFRSPSIGNAYANSFYLRIDPKSAVWVDSLQLEEGDASGYDIGMQAGIEPLSDGIYTRSKAASVIVSARSAVDLSEPYVLTLRGSGADGVERWVRTVDVPAGVSAFTNAVSIPSDSAGVFDLTLMLASRALPSKVAASTAWRITVIDGEFALPHNTLFGLDTTPAWSPMATLLSEEELARGFGAGMGRSFFATTTGWPVGLRTNTSVDNPMHVQVLREAYAVQKNAGKSVMIVFDAGRGSPLSLRSMSRGGKLIPMEEREAAIPEAAARMAAWISTLSNELDIAEIFNEPNIWIVGGEKGMPPELYVKVLAAVHAALRASKCPVRLAANINSMDFEYTEKFLALGGANYIDVFTVHPYRATAENPPLYEDYRRLRAMLDKKKPGIPVVNSEQYYGVRNLIYQGEHERNYFSDSEEDQAGRLLQTSLHGIAADRVPFSVFAAAALLAKEGISGSRYFYHYFGMLRTLSTLVRDVKRGEDIASDRSLRVFLFERADGTKVVTANTRIFGVKGTVKAALAADAVYDANGNRLTADAAPVGYVPTYWVFGRGVSSEDIRRAFRSATCRGFDFPVELSAQVRTDGKVNLSLRNVSTAAAGGTVRITAAADLWQFPQTIPFTIAPGTVSERIIDAAAGKPVWNAMYTLTYMAQSDELIVNRTLRIPSFSIPKAAKGITIDGELSDWTDAEWMVLDENALSKDFDPKLPHSGPADLKARTAFRWTEGGLYVAAQVRDDVVFHKGNSAILYESDSLQLYFDLGNSASSSVHAYDKDDVVYAVGVDKNGTAIANLEKSPGTRYIGENNVETGIDADVKTAYRATADGYVYEVFFPSFTLPFLAFKPGSVSGISLIINDNDGAGRKQGLTLGPKGTEPFSEPFLWRCAQLGE